MRVQNIVNIPGWRQRWELATRLTCSGSRVGDIQLPRPCCRKVFERPSGKSDIRALDYL